MHQGVGLNPTYLKFLLLAHDKVDVDLDGVGLVVIDSLGNYRKIYGSRHANPAEDDKFMYPAKDFTELLTKHITVPKTFPGEKETVIAHYRQGFSMSEDPDYTQPLIYDGDKEVVFYHNGSIFNAEDFSDPGHDSTIIAEHVATGRLKHILEDFNGVCDIGWVYTANPGVLWMFDGFSTIPTPPKYQLSYYDENNRTAGIWIGDDKEAIELLANLMRDPVAKISVSPYVKQLPKNELLRIENSYVESVYSMSRLTPVNIDNQKVTKEISVYKDAGFTNPANAFMISYGWGHYRIRGTRLHDKVIVDEHGIFYSERDGELVDISGTPLKENIPLYQLWFHKGVLLKNGVAATSLMENTSEEIYKNMTVLDLSGHNAGPLWVGALSPMEDLKYYNSFHYDTSASSLERTKAFSGEYVPLFSRKRYTFINGKVTAIEHLSKEEAKPYWKKLLKKHALRIKLLE